jgi:ATP-dependent Lon protease
MTATSTVPTSSTTRLPIAHLPSAVLPGATVTLTLATDELRLAITAATDNNGGRILLTGGDEHGALASPRPTPQTVERPGQRPSRMPTC